MHGEKYTIPSVLGSSTIPNLVMYVHMYVHTCFVRCPDNYVLCMSTFSVQFAPTARGESWLSHVVCSMVRPRKDQKKTGDREAAAATHPNDEASGTQVRLALVSPARRRWRLLVSPEAPSSADNVASRAPMHGGGMPRMQRYHDVHKLPLFHHHTITTTYI